MAKKIELNKKTLRVLSADEAMAVAGGTWTAQSQGWECESMGCWYDTIWDCTADCPSFAFTLCETDNFCPWPTDIDCPAPTEADCPEGPQMTFDC